MSHLTLHRWLTGVLLLALVFYAGYPAVAQTLMPPNPHLPADVRAAMQADEALRAGQWKHLAHAVRDAGKQQVVNNPASAPVQVLVSGNKQMPCILMRFPDYANTYTTGDFQNLLFTAGGVATGSAADYYTEISFGQLSLSGQVDGWFTTNNSKAYYGDRTRRYADCAYEAAQKANAASFNWAPYDNDHDGYVDTLWVVHAGLGAEESGNTRTDIWSHSWDFASAGKGVFTTSTPDPYHPGSYIKINNYIIQPETSYWSGGAGLTPGIVGIGVFCHEFGHALGLPDLYDTAGSGEGLGNASLMAAGSWGGDGDDSRYPAHMDPWCKAFLGWISPTVVTADGSYTLNDIERSGNCMLVKPAGSTVNQYFLVENREHYGYDRTLFATGLFIYHIDSDIIAAYSDANTVNANTHAFGVALEEADATLDSYASMHLFTGTNRGVAADAWPNGTKNAFSITTVPSTKTNAGAFQGCGITDISAKGDAMTMSIAVALTPQNVAPVAGNDSVSATAGKALAVRAPGVLKNDTDANNDPLTALLVTTTTKGALTLSANGAFTYTPNAGFVGTDTFTYQTSDGQALSNVATVTITVAKKGR